MISCQITFSVVALTFVALSVYELGFPALVDNHLGVCRIWWMPLHIACLPWRCFTFKLSALWSNWRCFQQSNWNLTMHRTLAIASSYSCREHSTPGRYEFNHFAHYGSTYTISAGVDQRFLIPFTFAVPCPSSLYVCTNCTVQLSFCVLSSTLLFCSNFLFLKLSIFHIEHFTGG